MMDDVVVVENAAECVSIDNEIQYVIDSGLMRLAIRYHTHVETLTAYLGCATSVRELSINHNTILRSLPSTLSDLSENLTRLDVSHNALSSLPETIGLLCNLTSLNVSHNRLTTIPFGVGAIQLLRELNVSHNSISHFSYDLRDLQTHFRFQFKYDCNPYLNPAVEYFPEVPLNVTHCAQCGDELPFDAKTRGPSTTGRHAFGPIAKSFVAFLPFVTAQRIPFAFYVCDMECFLDCYKMLFLDHYKRPNEELSLAEIAAEELSQLNINRCDSPVHDKYCRCTL
jgi:Leucine-rich repeat (LRR) protein